MESKLPLPFRRVLAAWHRRQWLYFLDSSIQSFYSISACKLLVSCSGFYKYPCIQVTTGWSPTSGHLHRKAIVLIWSPTCRKLSFNYWSTKSSYILHIVSVSVYSALHTQLMFYFLWRYWFSLQRFLYCKSDFISEKVGIIWTIQVYIIHSNVIFIYTSYRLYNWSIFFRHCFN